MSELLRGMASGNNAYDKIFSHIDEHGVPDKDASRTEKSSRRVKRKRKSRKTVDLHGLTSEQAYKLVGTTIEQCRNRGIRELLIVHGRGIHSDPNRGAVLKRTVREMLQTHLSHLVISFYPASPSEGGDGATVVVLR